MIKIKKINDLARIPVRANSTDAGADLYSTESLIIPPLSRALVKTGIIIEIPENYYGRIAPRSGLAFKNGIDVMAGVIDSGYRNELGVILYNTDQFQGFEVKIGDRIAQLIIEAHYNFKIQETSELSDTERGSGGFGSTGSN